MSANSTKEKWSRPKSAPVPTVWRRFTGLKKMEDGTIPKFRIQDVPDDMHEDVIEFMTKHFFRDEVTCECLHLLEDEVSMREFQDVYREILTEHVALVAFLDDDNEPGVKPKIAGCNLTAAAHRSEKFKGRVMRTVMRDLYEDIGKAVNVYDIFGVDEYMTALGLCVDPIYRGQGLGLEILKARTELGKAIGLSVTMTVFTAVSSQILAARVGMEVLKEIDYEEFKEPDGTPAYPNIKCKSLKVMAKRLY
ncbi:hypothetical protein C0J52_19757 [Blattella germanica]|nr:hypothetical protein C0J52_19757 [Blattella germanica]